MAFWACNREVRFSLSPLLCECEARMRAAFNPQISYGWSEAR